MGTLWQRINAGLLMLVLLALLTIISMMALDAEGGPLDPPGTPGPTDSVRQPGTPIFGPTTISSPGHYYLTRNISVSGAQGGIVITSTNVSLDLGGFTIDGTDFAGSIGVGTSGEINNIVISNGTVTDFNIGVHTGSAVGARIDNVRALNNFRGIEVGSYSEVVNCYASFNGETGIYVPGVLTTVRNCTVLSNVSGGVTLAGTANIIESSIVHSFGVDILVTANGNVVRDNYVGDIQISAGTSVVNDNVIANTITGPGAIITGTNHDNTSQD